MEDLPNYDRWKEGAFGPFTGNNPYSPEPPDEDGDGDVEYEQDADDEARADEMLDRDRDEHAEGLERERW